MSRRKGAQAKKQPRENVYAAPEFKPLHGPHNSVLAPRVVEDVYDGKPITAMASIRDDPLGRYYARGQIDFAQWSAAGRWLKWWEDAALGGLRGYEMKDPVSGGGQFPESFSDKKKKAVEELYKAKLELGKQGDWILREVLGNRRFIIDLVVSSGEVDPLTQKPRQRAVDYLSGRFRECLETLAVYYGLVSGKNRVSSNINGNKWMQAHE